MRDKVAYKLMSFILNHVATKKYQALVNTAGGIGCYVIENELEHKGEDEWSEPARFGQYVLDNWEEFENDV